MMSKLPYPDKRVVGARGVSEEQLVLKVNLDLDVAGHGCLHHASRKALARRHRRPVEPGKGHAADESRWGARIRGG